MTGSNAGPGSNRIWLLAGLLAVVAVGGYFSLNYPPSSEDTAGTIVPAKRYQAADAGGAAGGTATGDASIASPGADGITSMSSAVAGQAGQAGQAALAGQAGQAAR